jgi:hypothetical protein
MRQKPPNRRASEVPTSSTAASVKFFCKITSQALKAIPTLAIRQSP